MLPSRTPMESQFPMHLQIALIVAIGLQVAGLPTSSAQTTTSSQQETDPDFDVFDLDKSSFMRSEGPESAASSKTYLAFVGIWKDAEFEVDRDILVIQDRGSKRLFGIRSLGLPHRPIGPLKWVSPTRLQFDIWATPHFGHRYVMNSKTRKISELGFIHS
jgi:hypothetical protein